MPIVTQQLRTTSATKIPDGLAPGQIAFNLANKWMFVGVGGDDILTPTGALTGYGTTTTVLGVSNVTVPAKPTGKGYEIFDLEEGGVTTGATNPTTGTKGQLFVNTGSTKPTLLMYDGTSWGAPVPSPAVYTLTTAEVTAGAGGSQTAKMTAALITKVATVSASTDFKTGDTCIVTGTAATNAAPGSFIWDGSTWVAAGAGLPDATARTGTANTGTAGTKGVVFLARDIDVLPAGATGATTPDPLAVATATQLKATNAQIASLQGGTALLGTYNGSTSAITSVDAEAVAGGRGGLTVGAKLSAGTGLHAGDFFIVHAAGTIAGEATAINVAVNSGDTLMYTGTTWQVIATGPVMAGLLLHGCTDVSDTTVATVTAANTKGILVRDSSVAADGAANAYKLVSVIDLGSF